MRSRILLFLGTTLLPAIFAIAENSPALAQGSLDFYGGALVDGTADVSVSETRSSGTTSARATIDLSTTAEFGVRLAGWLPSHDWFGLAMDLGYYHADGEGVDIDVFPFSFAVTVRAPLFPTPDRPAGRLQPYAMGGVTFHMVDLSVELEGMGGDAFFAGWPFPGADELVLGPYLAAGLSWQPAKSIAIFGEYRYSTFDIGFDTVDSPLFPTMNGRVDTSLESDHVLAGVAYRFGG
jgi:outer membrane protein with beta-barrel domain